MLLVAGQHLVAGPELQAADHGIHPVGGGAGERDLRGGGAQQLRGPPAQLARQLQLPLELRHSHADALDLVAQLLAGRLARCAGRRPHGSGVQVGDPLEDRELGAQGGGHGAQTSLVSMIVERSMKSPEWLSNAYLVADEPGGKAVIIDSGGPSGPLLEKIEEYDLTPTHLLLTHHHADHVAENHVYKEKFGVEILAHPLEAERLLDVDRTIDPGREGARGRRPEHRRAAHAGPHRRDAQLRGEPHRRVHRRHALQGLGGRREGPGLDHVRGPEGARSWTC